jgi:hypothetical protein
MKRMRHSALLCLSLGLVLPVLSQSPSSLDPRASAESDETSGPAPTPDGLIDPKAAPRQAPDLQWSSIDPRTKVNWKGVLLQSGFFLGIEQAFRLGTEAGTRVGMKGPFLEGYLDSVGNLHGWGDGDEFYVNYIGHPMQGSVAGYIWVRNDIPRYRYAEFGKNQDYWMGRLRALAYSWAYSAQFEIGAISEASIGKIQAQYPQQGFVDQVVTPVIGLGWMLAEDSLDKYVIKWFERRVRNQFIVMLVRGGLNPSRSFANAMAWQYPWLRDTRPNLFGPDPKGEAVRAKLIADEKNRSTKLSPNWEEATAVVAPFEFNLSFQPSMYLGAGGTPCLGGGAAGAVRIASRWQAVLDVGGCKLVGLEKNWSGDSLHYLAGVRWTPWASGRWSTRVQMLAGGEKLTHDQVFPAKQALLTAIWKAQGSDPDKAPTYDQFAYQSDTNGFSLQGGVGLDYRVNSAIQLQLATADYRHTWVPYLDGRSYRSSLNLSTGLVLRIGTW